MTDKERVRTDPAALRPYLRAGYTLLPLFRWDRVSTHKNGKPRQDGKRPLDTDWVRKPYRNADQVAHMERGSNVGVRLTAQQLVIDVDPRNMPEGRNTFLELCAAVALDPDDYPQVNTGSGGLHVYMTKPADVAVVDSLEGYDGVEFKTRGRQVVAAGSRHPDGGMYSWDPLAPELSEARAAPERLLSLIRRPSRSAGQNAGGGEYDQQQIAEMLDALDPEDFKDHERWLTLMQACHHASNGDARSEFIEWSTRDDDYAGDAWIIGRRWDSLHREGRDGHAVTYRTLHKYMRDAGREDAVPRVAAEDDFEDDLTLPGDDEFDDELPDHEKKGPMTRLNETYCAVDDGGRFRIYYELFDPSEDRKKWQSMDKTNFEAYLMNRKVEKTKPNRKGEPETTVVPLSQEWLQWGNRRTARGVIFDPERDHPGFLNLWTGWAVDPKPGDWSLMQELIERVLCDDEPEAFDFVMNWMAYMVQKPWMPPEVAIAFHGNKGTGKSTLGRALAALAGRHGRQITSSEHITGRFNSHLMDVVFLFADEAVRPTDREAQNRLKAMITESTLQFEAKGKDLRSGMNRLHVMMASNDEWFVPMGLVDGERRYFVSRVNDSRRQDHAFFGAIERQMYHEGGLGAMLHDLQLRDIARWAPRGNVPATGAVVEQKLRNMDPVAQWWFEKLESGDPGFEFSRDGDDWELGAVRAFHQDVKEDFELWCKRRDIKASSMNRGIDRYFTAEFCKVCPNLKKENRDPIPDDRPGIRPAGSSGRARSYEFPSLDDCRADFEAAIEGTVEWPQAAD